MPRLTDEELLDLLTGAEEMSQLSIDASDPDPIIQGVCQALQELINFRDLYPDTRFTRIIHTEYGEVEEQ